MPRVTGGPQETSPVGPPPHRDERDELTDVPARLLERPNFPGDTLSPRPRRRGAPSAPAGDVRKYSPDQPRGDRGQWTGSGGQVEGLTGEDRSLMDHWAWPNSNPLRPDLSYERLRDPGTDGGRRMTALLGRMPLRDGVTYRGVALDRGELARLTSSGGMTLRLHSSSSTDPDVVRTFADAQAAGEGSRRVVLEMHGRGRDVAAHLPEDLRDTREVVLTAGTAYQFVRVVPETRRDPFQRVVMRELR